MARIGCKNVRVGTGGWLEYKKGTLPAEMKLRAYSGEFDFVEVNATFYRIIHPKTIELWRLSVPPDFEFSIKCYKALTHEIGLRPVEDAFRVFNMMQNYCKILSSNILVMQMPPSLKLDQKFVSQARDFFKSVEMGDVRIALEFRTTPSKLSDGLVTLLQDFNVVHTVDLTCEEPRLENDILYSRVFGMPEKKNRLDNNDLEQIKEKVEVSESSEVRIVGHSLKMIEDTRKIKDTLIA